MKNKGRGFTLVELLAVIVILAVILIIAVPKISDTIKNSKIASFESSAKTIATQAEKKKMELDTLEYSNSISCSDLVNLNDSDYMSCNVYFSDDTAYVTLYGSGKFEGLQIVNGTKENTIVEEVKAPSYGNAASYVNGLYAYDANTNGLEKDTTEDGNIRYVGSNPKNYVEFNGETWRIIGVFGSNLKLVRNDFLTSYSFDNKTKEQGIETDYGTNDWTNSYIREFLNDYYYDDKEIICHSQTSGDKATNEVIDCPTITILNETAKDMIQTSTWYLGGTTYKTKNAPYETYPVNELYTSERGTKVYGKHATTSTDNVGLIYPSDYGYASTDTSCRQNLKSRLDSETPTCKNNNWLYKDSWYWTISPYSSLADYVFGVSGVGILRGSYASYRYGVRPSVYLKSNVRIVSGSGTEDDKFKLKI